VNPRPKVRDFDLTAEFGSTAAAEQAKVRARRHLYWRVRAGKLTPAAAVELYDMLGLAPDPTGHGAR